MTVFLVGAGPGDPGLLTVRAAELLAAADVVVHDRLAEASLLDLAPPKALRIDVGKVPGGPVDQDGINAILVEHGRTGAAVVRLKGGDPFVFGRGGEEALALVAAGVAFEVVPGITSAIAAAAYAGIPVTHRGLSTSLTVVTGHSRHAIDTETDWASLARAGGTIVVLMGVAHRGVIAARLLAGGLAPTTPVAAVHRGTRTEQRTTRTTLAAVGDVALEAPCAIVIGAVAGLDLGWFETRPLFGRTVVVTRAQDRAATLGRRLRALGATVLEVPTIRTVPASDGGAALAAALARPHEWLALTSVNGVDATFSHLRDARALGSTQVAAVGTATAAALRARGVEPDLVPATATAAALAAAFQPGPGRVLAPLGDLAGPDLADGLAAKGWTVAVVEAYRTVPAAVVPDRLWAAAAADAITFTSASTVTGWLAAAGGVVPPVVATIGPVTSDAARAAGLRVDVEAEVHSVDGLVDALARHLATVPRAR